MDGADSADPRAELFERIVKDHEARAENDGEGQGAAPAPGARWFTRYWWHTAWLTFTVVVLVAAYLVLRIVG